MKRIAEILLACVLVFTTALSLPLTASASEAKTRTVMLYIVGSNLESGDGSATGDLLEGMNADYDENLNIIAVTGDYTGTIVKTFRIKKAQNKLKVKGKTKTVKRSRVKNKKLRISRKKLITVTTPCGKVTYAKVSGNGKIVINKKTGRFTLKKGLKKGTYKVKLKVKAAGNASYEAATKKVTVKIVVE